MECLLGLPPKARAYFALLQHGQQRTHHRHKFSCISLISSSPEGLISSLAVSQDYRRWVQSVAKAKPRRHRSVQTAHQPSGLQLGRKGSDVGGTVHLSHHLHSFRCSPRRRSRNLINLSRLPLPFPSIVITMQYSSQDNQTYIRRKVRERYNNICSECCSCPELLQKTGISANVPITGIAYSEFYIRITSNME